MRCGRSRQSRAARGLTQKQKKKPSNQPGLILFCLLLLPKCDRPGETGQALAAPGSSSNQVQSRSVLQRGHPLSSGEHTEGRLTIQTYENKGRSEVACGLEKRMGESSVPSEAAAGRPGQGALTMTIHSSRTDKAFMALCLLLALLLGSTAAEAQRQDRVTRRDRMWKGGAIGGAIGAAGAILKGKREAD